MEPEIEGLMARFVSNQLSQHTRKAYRCDIQAFLGRFTDRALDEIAPEEIAGYRDELLERLQPSTVARKLTVVRQFLSFCVDVGVLEHNPAQMVRSPKVPQYSTTNGLTREQAESLLRQPDRSTVKGKRDYAILSLMLHNGLRNSEVTAIRWGDFREERGYMILNVHGKGGKEAVTKIKPVVMAAIKDYAQASGRELDEDSPLFIGQKTCAGIRWNTIGNPLSTEAVRFMVKRHGRMAGIDKRISPHSLRHTCVTLCLDGGGTVRHAQNLARHEDPKTTIRYDRNRNNLDDHGTDYVRLNV
ncbi:tyrosine-type recombinase/integrase [Candidatus Poribacteria bacterium]